MIKYTIVLMVLLSYVSCAQPQDIKITSSSQFQILDSLSASKLIIKDDVEHFFDKLSILEMEIQMKDTVSLDSSSRKKAFIDFIASETMDFTIEEKALISSVMDSAIVLVNKLNPNLLQNAIQLIKINTNHYGPSVYYTRENGIYIPKNALAKADKNELLTVMLHEIAHIVSRSDPTLKKALYELIGFKPLEGALIYPQVLLQKILINPDGVNDDFFIPVKDKKTGESYRVVPIISSDKDSYRLSSPMFFDYLKFDLYAIDDSNTVLINTSGNSTLRMDQITGFFEEIEDNTAYIIHPDEIIADNFMLLLLALEKNDFDNFSPEGMVLLNDIKRVLIDYDTSKTKK